MSLYLDCLTKAFVFYDIFTRKLHMLMTCIEASFLSACIFAYALQEPLVEQNLFQVAAAASLFSFWALRAYTAYKEESISMEEVSGVKEPSDVLIFLSLLNQSLNHQTSESEIMLTNLKTAHIMGCSTPNCFCREAKGNELLRKLVLEKIEGIMENFKQDITVVVVSIYLRLELFEIYVDSYYDMLVFEQTLQFSWSEKIAFQAFKNELSAYFRRKNYTLEIIETEKALQLQSRVEEIEDVLEELLNKKSHFWQTICKRIINAKEMEANFEWQLAAVKEVNKDMLRQIEAYGDNPQMIILFSYFVLCIELKNNLPSQLTAKLKALEQKKDVSFVKLLSKSNSNLLKLIFRNESCTFESEICEGKMGIIKNATKTVSSVFGQDASSLIGTNVSALMPRSLRSEHDEILERWRRGSSWENIGKLKEVYCVDQKGSCFSADLYLKVFQNPNSLSIIASIFKKNQHDCLVLSEKGIIDGVGHRFLRVLGKIQGLPLRLISNERPKLISKSTVRNKKSLFYSTKCHKEEIEEIREKIEEGIFSRNDEK